MKRPPGSEGTMLGPGAAPSAAPAPPQPPGSAAQPTPTAGPGDLPAGTAIGEYVVERELGRGGMGAVYAAQHPVIGKRVAIKVLAAAYSADPAIVRRFVDEARAVNKIGHPNIIDIFSFGQLPDGRQYFVMEYLEGETLAVRLESGPLAGDEARRLLVQTCSGLAAAHSEKIIHRDLKPENLWIARPKHGDAFIKILDFGIAKLMEVPEGQQVTQTGMVMGTPHYMSPEQCTGHNVDHRTDIYALGVLLYRTFTGRTPFEGRAFAEIVAQHLTAVPQRPGSLCPMPASLERLILSCLDKDPTRRPQSAAEVGARLEEALAGTTTATIALPPGMNDAGGTRPGFATGSAAARALEAAPEAPRRWGRLVVALVLLGAIGGGLIAVQVGKRLAQRRVQEVTERARALEAEEARRRPPAPTPVVAPTPAAPDPGTNAAAAVQATPSAAPTAVHAAPAAAGAAPATPSAAPGAAPASPSAAPGAAAVPTAPPVAPRREPHAAESPGAGSDAPGKPVPRTSRPERRAPESRAPSAGGSKADRQGLVKENPFE